MTARVDKPIDATLMLKYFSTCIASSKSKAKIYTHKRGKADELSNQKVGAPCLASLEAFPCRVAVGAFVGACLVVVQTPGRLEY